MRLPLSTSKKPCSYGSISGYNSVITHLLLVPRCAERSIDAMYIVVVIGRSLDDYTASPASADQLSSQPSRAYGSPFPGRQPVYHTSCHQRKWHGSRRETLDNHYFIP